MPRLFTGIILPEEFAEILAFRSGNIAGARWVESGDFHITLHFIGDIEKSLSREVDFVLGRIKHQRFRLRLNGLDIFGAKIPRTLFSRIQSNEQLNALQAKQKNAMQQLGLGSGSRKYSPHVTLARLGGAKSVDVRNYLNGAGQFTPLEFEVEGFALFSARGAIGGGPYTNRH